MAVSQPLPSAPCGAEYLRAVLRSPVYEVAQVTPLQAMSKISSRLGNTILVKREEILLMACNGVTCATS